MRVVWKYGKTYSMKLRDDLHTIGQLLKSPVLLVYDIKSEDGNWSKHCLDGIKPLFRVYVGSVIHNLMDKRINVEFSEEVIDDFENFQWISPHLFDEHPDWDGTKYNYRLHPLFLGGKLVQHPPNEMHKIPYEKKNILNYNLKLPEDREIIEKTEMTNMWGANDLQDRLIRYFDLGIDRDDLKFFAFPGLWDDVDQFRPLTRRVPPNPGWGLKASEGAQNGVDDLAKKTQNFYGL